ncbi:MAG: glycosyltransferase family 4 protein [Spirochaetes bacterium]|nr:glycosyltransferase family 4 protein [Spirochaetota bacterium]
MKILMLSWEFPPLIAGGLGMAVYGMVKHLIELGNEILLILPTKYDVYFHLKNEYDLDNLNPIFLSKDEHILFEKDISENKYSIYKALGLSIIPETYFSDADYYKFYEFFYESFDLFSRGIPFYIVKEIESTLEERGGLFGKVRDYTLRVSRIVNKINFDIVHCHDWLTYPAGLVLKMKYNKKLVAHIHATEFDRAGNNPGDDRIHKIEYAGLTYSDRVIAVSNYTANIIVYRYKIDTRKIRVIHNAFYLKNPEKRSEIKRFFKRPVVLFLGRITLQKGPDYFIEVAKNVISQIPNVLFIMVGAGDMQRKLIHKSAYYKLRANLLFSNFLNRQQVEKILSMSDIFVLPSVSEPFGIAPLEAMAAGLVAIISKQSGVSEIVNNAFKVDFWDVNKMSEIIIDLIKNPDKMKEIAEKGAKEVNKINWLRVAREINKVYMEII